jgi:5-methyltetrahydrofolate--homocysteine methyltransferase
MVTPERIIAAAIEHNVDILVGLITPSLDEMVYLAKELDKQNIKIHDWWCYNYTSRAHTNTRSNSRK